MVDLLAQGVVGAARTGQRRRIDVAGQALQARPQIARLDGRAAEPEEGVCVRRRVVDAASADRRDVGDGGGSPREIGRREERRVRLEDRQVDAPGPVGRIAQVVDHPVHQPGGLRPLDRYRRGRHLPGWRPAEHAVEEVGKAPVPLEAPGVEVLQVAAPIAVEGPDRGPARADRGFDQDGVPGRTPLRRPDGAGVASHPGVDPALPQMVWEGGHGRVHRRLVADDAVVEHIAARVQRHPARRAGRALGEVPAETGGLPREARQMGRLHRGVPQVLEAVAAPLVQGDEQDVSEHRIPFFGSAWWSAGRRRAQRCKPSAAQACSNCFV